MFLIFISLMLALALAPIVGYLVKKKVPRGVAVLIIYLILAIVVPREPGKGVVVDREEKVREMVEEVGERVKKLKKK